MFRATRLLVSVLALASVLSGCGPRGPRGASSAATGVRWLPNETMAARAAIDAQWGIVDRHVGQAARRGRIVGAEVLVVTPEGWSARGYGRATAQATPNERTVYELGSITKVFTGTLLAAMSLRGEVSLTEPAQELLPRRTRMPRSSRPITLMDLATHASGMPPNPPPGLTPAGPADFAARDLWDALEEIRLVRQPAVLKQYSNLGVGLLGQLLVNRADAASYEALISERILGPLGMVDTTVELRDDQLARMAWGHDEHNRRTDMLFVPALVGAGGLHSTGRDMAVFVQAHLRRDSPIAAAARVALEPRRVPSRDRWDQGLGWVVTRDGRTAWHNGTTAGFHAWLGIATQERVGVLLLCNTATSDVDRWGTAILSSLRTRLGAPPVADDGARLVAPANWNSDTDHMTARHVLTSEAASKGPGSCLDCSILQ